MDFLLYKYPTFSTRLCEYLPYISRLSLKKAFPNMRVMTDVWDFSILIASYLDKLGFNGYEICQILKDTPNTVLSGSLLLKCLNGDDWDANDMDIYSKSIDKFVVFRSETPFERVIDLDLKINTSYTCRHNTFTHQLLVNGIIRYERINDDTQIKPYKESYLIDSGSIGDNENTVNGNRIIKDRLTPIKRRKIENTTTPPVDVIQPHINDKENWNHDILKYDYTNSIFNVLQFKCLDTDFSVQDILVKDEYQISDVIDEFDMSFLQNTYDGKKIVIRNPYYIIKKECTVKFGMKYRNYIFRGVQSIYINRCIKIINRIGKYRKRGYTLHILNEITSDDQFYNFAYNNSHAKWGIIRWNHFVETARNIGITLDYEITVDQYKDSVVRYESENESQVK